MSQKLLSPLIDIIAVLSKGLSLGLSQKLLKIVPVEALMNKLLRKNTYQWIMINNFFHRKYYSIRTQQSCEHLNMINILCFLWSCWNAAYMSLFSSLTNNYFKLKNLELENVKTETRNRENQRKEIVKSKDATFSCNHRIINIGKRPVRCQVHPLTPSHPQNHIVKCHIQLFFEHL